MANGFLTTCSHGGISEATTGIEVELSFSTVTTGKGIQLDMDALTTGTGLEIRVDSDIVTSGKAIDVKSGSAMTTSVFNINEDGDAYIGGALDVASTATITSTATVGTATSTGTLTGGGTGRYGLKLRNLLEASTGTLSGTGKIIEIDMAGTTYYFEVLPTLA